MPLPLRKAVMKPLLMGANFDPNILSIRDDQAYSVQNFHIDENGVAYSRLGSRVLNTTSLDGKIVLIYDFLIPGSSSILVAISGKLMYKWNSTTSVFDPVYELVSRVRPSIVTFQDGNGVTYMFLANGTDFIKYNGDNVTSITFVTGIDNPRYIRAYDDRLLAAGCDSDPYKVFVSDTLDGTTWTYGASSTAHYWTVSGQKGSGIKGLGTMYSYGLIFQQFSVDLINEADPDSTTSIQRQITSQYGTTSHWSIVTVGDKIYFAGQEHIYVGILRDAIDEGLVVKAIDDNIWHLYKNITNATDIVSVYDPVHNEILWGIKTKGYGYNDYAIIYNLKRSSPEDNIHVWSGWFCGAGYEPYTFASVKTSAGKNFIYRGDETGHVYVMEEAYQYKDETVSSAGVVVDKDIPYEIITAPIMPYGLGVTKRARQFYPYLSQRYDGSTKVQWIVNSSFILPGTDHYITLYNRVPFWRSSATTKMKQLWGATVWAHDSVMPRPVTLNEGFQYLQFKIINTGSNARDRLTYGGGELWYQIHKIRRTAG